MRFIIKANKIGEFRYRMPVACYLLAVFDGDVQVLDYKIKNGFVAVERAPVFEIRFLIDDSFSGKRQTSPLPKEAKIGLTEKEFVPPARHDGVPERPLPSVPFGGDTRTDLEKIHDRLMMIIACNAAIIGLMVGNLVTR